MRFIFIFASLLCALNAGALTNEDGIKISSTTQGIDTAKSLFTDLAAAGARDIVMDCGREKCTLEWIEPKAGPFIFEDSHKALLAELALLESRLDDDTAVDKDRNRTLKIILIRLGWNSTP